MLRAPLEVCIERAETREGPFLADPDVIRQLWESFADLGELEPNAIELDGEGPEAVADIIAARLEAGELGDLSSALFDGQRAFHPGFAVAGDRAEEV